jgi:hypothetical protein
LRLQFVHKVSEFGIDDATKLLAATGHVCEHVATNLRKTTLGQQTRVPRRGLSPQGTGDTPRS